MIEQWTCLSCYNLAIIVTARKISSQRGQAEWWKRDVAGKNTSISLNIGEIISLPTQTWFEAKYLKTRLGTVGLEWWKVVFPATSLNEENWDSPDDKGHCIIDRVFGTVNYWVDKSPKNRAVSRPKTVL